MLIDKMNIVVGLLYISLKLRAANNTAMKRTTRKMMSILVNQRNGFSQFLEIVDGVKLKYSLMATRFSKRKIGMEGTA